MFCYASHVVGDCESEVPAPLAELRAFLNMAKTGSANAISACIIIRTTNKPLQEGLSAKTKNKYISSLGKK